MPPRLPTFADLHARLPRNVRDLRALRVPHVHIPLLPSHPVVRPFLTIVLLTVALYSLLAHWEHHGGNAPTLSPAQKSFDISVMNTNAHQGDEHQVPVGEVPHKAERKVVAHFMLGNTYPFKQKSWDKTLNLVEDAGLDGLSLNLGKEDWQYTQMKDAYQLAQRRIYMQKKGEGRPVQLFISLDMNVIESKTWKQAEELIEHIAPLLRMGSQLLYDGRPILSTFGGHDASWGHKGWHNFLEALNYKLEKPVMFWPAFFVDSVQFPKISYVDGTFGWNNAWPKGNTYIRLTDDQPLMEAGKPFMAAVSPLFFTHYGKTGDWAFDKNFIYKSDDLLYPSRWDQILRIPDAHAPDIVQVISWNDYGESHYIGPIMGAQPGSGKWTRRMSHRAFREMTAYFTGRWRDGASLVDQNYITVWMWYRVVPKDAKIRTDPVGRPANADWATDVINVMVVLPPGLEDAMIDIINPVGETHPMPLRAGRLNMMAQAFKPGHVKFTLRSKAGVHMRGKGRTILKEHQSPIYNFNHWTGAWHQKVKRDDAGVVRGFDEATVIVDDFDDEVDDIDGGDEDDEYLLD